MTDFLPVGYVSCIFCKMTKIRIKKFVDEEIALKKANAEVKYKQQPVKMNLDLLAAKMVDEVAIY